MRVKGGSASRTQKRPRARFRRSTLQALLEDELDVHELALVMDVDPGTIREWRDGYARPSSMAQAFLIVLNHARRRWSRDLRELLPGRRP